MTALDTSYELDREDFARIGDWFISEKNWKKAAGCYSKAMTVPANNKNDILTKYAMAMTRAGEFRSATWAIARAFEINPDNPYACHVDALRCMEEGDWATAEPQLKRGIQLLPDNAAFHVNLAHLYQILGDFGEAEKAYDMACLLEPVNLEARFYRSMTRITQGKFVEGFREYELRYALYPPPVPVDGTTIWRGQETLAGKSILLCAEQGIGDAVQFARYGTWLKQVQGASRVVALALPMYARLLGGIAGLDEVVTSAKLDAYDYHAPMMSMPGLSLSGLIDGAHPWYGVTPYLTVERNDYYNPPRSGSRKLVGFCWQGNRAHGNDRFRSIPQALFDQFCGLANIDCVNLQHDLTHELMMRPAMPDVYSLAQMIRELDLVVTVDTAVAHIAGAMGVPCWVLIASNPDWRWGIGSETTPWYSSLRLFRQAEPLKWEPVVDRVKKELEVFAS